MPAGQEDYQFNGIARDYVRYEREARGVVLSILWDNKWAAVKTFLVHKPRLLAKQLAWAIGYRGYSIDDLYLNGQAKTIATERDRADRMIYLNFFRPWALAGLLVAAWLGGAAGSRRPFLELWRLSLLLCAVSLLPTMAAYPIISNLGPPLATVSFFVLAGFTWLFARAIAPVTQWTMAAAARRAQPDNGASVAS